MRIPLNLTQPQSYIPQGSLHRRPFGSSVLPQEQTVGIAFWGMRTTSTSGQPLVNALVAAKGVRFGSHLPLTEDRANHIYRQLLGISPAQQIYGLFELMGTQDVHHSMDKDDQRRLVKLERAAARYLTFNDEYTGEEGIKRQRVGARYLAMLALEQLGTPWGNDGLITHLREVGEAQIASSLAASVLTSTLSKHYPVPLDRQIQTQQRIKLLNQLLRANTQFPSFLLAQYAQPSEMTFLIHGLDETSYSSQGEINLPRAVPIVRVLVATALKSQGSRALKTLLKAYQQFRKDDGISLSGPDGLKNKNKLQLMSRTLQLCGEQTPAYLMAASEPSKKFSVDELNALSELLFETIHTLREDGSLLSGRATFTSDGNADAIGLAYGFAYTLRQLPQNDFDRWVSRLSELLEDNVQREPYDQDRHLPDVMMAVMMALDLRSQKIENQMVFDPAVYLRSLYNLLFNPSPTSSQKDWDAVSSVEYERWIGSPKPSTPLEGLSTAFRQASHKDHWEHISQWIQSLPIDRVPLRLSKDSFLYSPLIKHALPENGLLAKKVNGPIFPTPGLYHGEWEGLPMVQGQPMALDSLVEPHQVDTEHGAFLHAKETIENKRIGFYKDLIEAWLLNPETQNETFAGIVQGFKTTPRALGGFFEQWVEMFPNRLSDRTFYQSQGQAKNKLNKLRFTPETTDQLLILLRDWSKNPMPALGSYDAVHHWRSFMLNLFYQHPDTLPSTPWRPKSNQWFPADGSAYTPMMHTLLKLAMDTLDHTPPEAQLSEIEIAMTVFNMLKFGVPQWVLKQRQETITRLLHVLPELTRVELKDIDTDGNPAFFRAEKPINPRNIPHPYVGTEFPWSAFYNNPSYSSAPDIQTKQEKPLVVLRNYEVMMDLACWVQDKQTIQQGLLDVLNFFQQNSGQDYADENVIIRSLVRPELVDFALNGEQFNFDRFIAASIQYKLFENIPTMVRFAAPLVQSVRAGKQPPKAERGFFVMGAISQMGAYAVPELMEIAHPSSPYPPLERQFAQEILQDMAKPNHVLSTFASMPLLENRSKSAFLLDLLFPNKTVLRKPIRPEPLAEDLPSVEPMSQQNEMAFTDAKSLEPKRLLFRSMGSTQGDLVDKMVMAFNALEASIQSNVQDPPKRLIQELLYWVDRYQVSMSQGGARAVGPQLSQLGKKWGELLVRNPWKDPRVSKEMLGALCALNQRTSLPYLIKAWDLYPDWTDRKTILNRLAESRDPSVAQFLATLLQDLELDPAVLPEVWHGLAEAGNVKAFQDVFHDRQNRSAVVFESMVGALHQYRALPFAKALLNEVTSTLDEGGLKFNLRLALIELLGALSERDDVLSRQKVMDLATTLSLTGDESRQLKLAIIRTLYNHFDWDDGVRLLLEKFATDPDTAVCQLATLALEESQSEL